MPFADPEKQKASQRKYITSSKGVEWHRAYQRRYQKAARHMNPARHLFMGAKRRAAQKGIPFSIVQSDIVVPEFCPVLGIRLKVNDGCGPRFDSPSIDRIMPSLGYVKGNVIVVSQRANTIKSNALVDEIQAVANFYRRLIDAT